MVAPPSPRLNPVTRAAQRPRIRMALICMLIGYTPDVSARSVFPALHSSPERTGPNLAREPARRLPSGPLRRQPRPAPPSGPIAYPEINGTLGAVTAIIIALSSNWIVYERMTSIVSRLVKGVFHLLRSSLCTFLRYPPTVALVKMRGIIATDDEMRLGLSHAMLCPDSLRPELLEQFLCQNTMRSGDIVNLNRFERTLCRAFATPGARAVALLIDSPGGSPAQSSLIYRRLKSLRRRYPNVKLLCFVEDSAASGGYYIACAGDEIVADHNSLIGSIGVISRGFGYVSALKRKGVERRVHTAGDSKAGLDPYLPMRSRDLKRQRRLLNELHKNFITAVREGRGDRLRPDEAASLAFNSTSRIWSTPSKRKLQRMVKAGDGLFDGAVYSGEVAFRLGLVDGVGEMNSDLQRRYGKYVNIVPVEPQAPFDLLRFLRWLA